MKIKYFSLKEGFKQTPEPPLNLPLIPVWFTDSGCALGFIFLSPPFSPIRFFCAIFLNLVPDFWPFFAKKIARFWGFFRKKKSSFFNLLNSRDQARGRLGQSSRPRGRNFTLNGTQGEVEVSLKKKKKKNFFFF